MKLRREHYIILAIQVTEVLGWSLILPFLPFYAQEFGATPLVIGMIAASFSLFQFFSAPIMGRLSDHYGRRPMLMLSQFSTFLGFLILGYAKALWMIFLSRIVDGLLGSNYTIAQAYLSDISTKEERTKIFGLSGAAFGFGFLIGPGIGGYLSQYGYGIPSYIAAVFSLLTIIITYFFLPETVKRKKDLDLEIKVIDVDAFKSFFKDDIISSKLFQWTVFIMAHVVWVSSWALYAERQLGFNASDVGLFLTWIGAVSIVMRGFMLHRLIDRFGERKLQYVGFLAMFCAMIASVVITEKSQAFVIATLFPLGAGMVRPLALGSLSRLVDDKKQGAIMGITNSIGSMAQIIGPLVGGFMINYFIPGSIGLVAAVITSFGIALMLREDRMGMVTIKSQVKARNDTKNDDWDY